MIQRDDLSSISLDQLRAAQGWQQQYKLIIQWGKRITVKPEIRCTEHLIRGCEMPVWLVHEQEGEQHHFAFDSDSNVMNGLAAVLLVHFNCKTLIQITEGNVEQQLRDLGLERHLTPSRNNGFNSIIRRLYQLMKLDQ